MRPDEAHGVVDREACRDRAAGRVDVEVDVVVRIVGLEEEQLRDDDVGHVVVDLTPQEDHAVAQQPRIDVEEALATLVLLDHLGNHRH